MAVFTLLWWSDPESAIPWEYDCTKEIISLSRKFYDPQQIFQPGDLGKGLRTPREFYFGGQWDLITELAQDWGNRFSQGTIKTLCASGPSRKEQWPHKRLSQTGLWVSRSFWQRRGSTVACHGVGALDTPVLAQSIGRTLPLLPLPLPYFGLRANYREGTQPNPSRKNWIKDLQSMAPLIKARPRICHSQPLLSGSFHKLLSLPIRGQTEWKPQWQKTNQTDHLDHSLF